MSPASRNKPALELSRDQARALVLHAQGLASSRPFGSGKVATLRALEQLGYVQIDTISVVERAHHHVLWSRVPDYRPSYLSELVAGGKVFEYWSHAAAYLPMRDFRFSLPRKKLFADGHRHWFRRNKKIQRYVLDRITAEGALQAKDFESPRKAGNWFDWKPAKIALEQLFMQGSLMVRERKGFQKVYDLPERVLAPGVDTSFPSVEEQARHRVESTLREYGLASAREIVYLRKNLPAAFRRALRDVLEQDDIVPVKVEGSDENYFALTQGKALLDTLAGKTPAHSGVHILSPFDNLLIQRRRMNQLFDFDYQIECYLPAKKRKFGYFCLPLLWNGSLVGRLDAKADRPKKALEVRSLHLETKARKKFLADFRPAAQAFAKFNGCDGVVNRP